MGFVYFIIYTNNGIARSCSLGTGKCEIPKGIDPSMHSKITNNGGLLAYSDASWHKPNEIGYDMIGYNVGAIAEVVDGASGAEVC